MSLYSDADAFGLYTYYVAVKQHFTSDYDFFKYGGKLRLRQTSFDTRKNGKQYAATRACHEWCRFEDCTVC